MVVLNRIYTRTGDDGTTSLGSGERRKKYDLRVAAYGTLDEVNAVIGLARLHTASDARLDAVLARIQNDLFDVEADLCLSEKGPGGARLDGDRRAGRAGSRARSIGSTPSSRRCARSCCRAAVRLPPICISPARSAGAAERLMVELADQPGESVTRAIAEIRQPAVGFPVRRRAATPTTKARATCSGSPGRTGERDVHPVV